MLLITNPIKIIEYFLGLLIVVRGVYFAYSYVERSGDMLLVQSVGYPEVVLILGLFMAIAGIALLWSLVAENWKVEGFSLFGSSLLFFYLSFLNLVSGVPRPFTWVYPLTLAGVAATVWLHNKIKRSMDEQDEISTRRER